MNYRDIKPETIASLERYTKSHCPVGSFLRAVLCNDLVESISRADADNLAALPAIVFYVYNELPGNCWGSPEAYMEWVANRAPATIPGVLEMERVSA